MSFLYTNVTCGNLGNTTFSSQLPETIHLIITLIQIAVPVLLIIFGMLDLGKAVMAQKEDEIKKGQQTFFKRLIAAVLVYFVIVIVQIVIKFAAGDGEDIWNCVDCFINGPSERASISGGNCTME